MNADEVARKCRERICYASTNAEWPNRELDQAADLIERLKAHAEAMYYAMPSPMTERQLLACDAYRRDFPKEAK